MITSYLQKKEHDSDWLILFLIIAAGIQSNVINWTEGYKPQLKKKKFWIEFISFQGERHTLLKVF